VICAAVPNGPCHTSTPGRLRPLCRGARGEETPRALVALFLVVGVLASWQLDDGTNCYRALGQAVTRSHEWPLDVLTERSFDHALGKSTSGSISITYARVT
jgi:hypothetical protein